jgi:hypothetical protein
MWRSLLPVVGCLSLIVASAPCCPHASWSFLASDERLTITSGAKENRTDTKNSVDTSFTLPQYLVIWDRRLLQVASIFQVQGPVVEKPLQGKIVHGGTFMATKKKAKKKKH